MFGISNKEKYRVENVNGTPLIIFNGDFKNFNKRLAQDALDKYKDEHDDYKNFITKLEERPDAHLSPFDKADRKTGFEKFMSNKPVVDNVEETKTFIDRSFGLTLEKIINDIESNVYPDGTLGVIKTYNSNISLNYFQNYKNSLHDFDGTVLLDENYPLKVGFSIKKRYRNNLDIDMINLEMYAFAGETKATTPNLITRY